jgi:hypothetical protein
MTKPAVNGQFKVQFCSAKPIAPTEDLNCQDSFESSWAFKQNIRKFQTDLKVNLQAGSDNNQIFLDKLYAFRIYLEEHGQDISEVNLAARRVGSQARTSRKGISQFNMSLYRLHEHLQTYLSCLLPDKLDRNDTSQTGMSADHRRQRLQADLRVLVEGLRDHRQSPKNSYYFRQWLQKTLEALVDELRDDARQVNTSNELLRRELETDFIMVIAELKAVGEGSETVSCASTADDRFRRKLLTYLTARLEELREASSLSAKTRGAEGSSRNLARAWRYLMSTRRSARKASSKTNYQFRREVCKSQTNTGFHKEGSGKHNVKASTDATRTNNFKLNITRMLGVKLLANLNVEFAAVRAAQHSAAEWREGDPRDEGRRAAKRTLALNAEMWSIVTVVHLLGRRFSKPRWVAGSAYRQDHIKIKYHQLRPIGAVKCVNDHDNTWDFFNIFFLRRERMYTKLKYSRVTQFDIASGAIAALLAGFVGFLITEKFGFELSDSGDFYFLLMYVVFLCFTAKMVLAIAEEDVSTYNFYSPNWWLQFYLIVWGLIISQVKSAARLVFRS